MTQVSDLEYYAKRARDEADRANEALDPAVRQAHRQMADTYRRIVDSGEVPEPRTRHTLSPMRVD
jgi:hypothetical protein